MIVSSVAPPISCAKIRSHRDARPHQQLDAVLGDGAQRRAARFFGIGAIDHFRVNARPHGVEHIAPGQVDGGRPIEIEIDIGPVRRDQRVDHARHVAAGQVVGFEPPRGDARMRVVADAGLHGHDLGFDDRPRVHLPQAHADQAQQAHVGVRHHGLQPQLAVAEHHDHEHERRDQNEAERPEVNQRP